MCCYLVRDRKFGSFSGSKRKTYIKSTRITKKSSSARFMIAGSVPYLNRRQIWLLTFDFLIRWRMRRCWVRWHRRRARPSLPTVNKINLNLPCGPFLTDGFVNYLTMDMRPFTSVEGAGFRNMLHRWCPEYPLAGANYYQGKANDR